MEIEFLGTGTSTGVPQVGCGCEVCRSADQRDKRLRTSVIVRVKGVALLIDCGPDFRQQILRASNMSIDALLLTHIHFDHIGGIEDLRPYCLTSPLDIYAQPRVLDGLKARVSYCFGDHKYPGIPRFELHPLDNDRFIIKGVEIEPLTVMHYKLPVLGYRIGNMAYITDANAIPENTYRQLEEVDYLIINALRFEPHLSHFSLSESLAVIERLKPKQAWLIHMSHGIGLHSSTSKLLPPNVSLAHDTQIIQLPD